MSEQTAAEGRPRSTPRAVVVYLKGVRGLVARANDSRQRWIRQLGMLLRAGDADAALEAGKIGLEQGAEFRKLRYDLAQLAPPAACDSCQVSLTSWLDKHIAACEIMVEVGHNGELARLRSTQGLLAEARIDLQRFNSDCDTLVAALRRRVENSKLRKAGAKKVSSRWPFGHQPKAAV